MHRAVGDQALPYHQVRDTLCDAPPRALDEPTPLLLQGFRDGHRDPASRKPARKCSDNVQFLLQRCKPGLPSWGPSGQVSSRHNRRLADPMSNGQATIVADAVVIRPAAPADAGTIVDLIRELAIYEREPLTSVKAREADMLSDG